jgi:hypothetical protein
MHNSSYFNSPYYQKLFFLALCCWFMLVLAPSNAADPETEFLVNLEKGRLALQMKRWQELEAAAVYLLKSQPELIEAQYMLGMAELHQGRFEAAASRFTWLCGKSPSDGAYRYNLARALEGAKLVDQAIVQAKYAVQLEPRNNNYKLLLQRLCPVSEKKPDEKKESDSLSSQHKSSQPDKPQQEIKTLTEQDKKVIALAAKCNAQSENRLELILTALKESPDLIANQNWGSQIAKFLTDRQTDFSNELIRLFLLWKSGKIIDKDFQNFLNQAEIGQIDWSGKNSSYIKEQFQNAGLTHFVSENLKNCQAWYDLLNEPARIAFFDIRYEDAWNEHNADRSGKTTSLWNYQSARLALELWQIKGFSQKWLETAYDHLLICREKAFKKEETDILIAQIEHYLRK